MTTKARGLVASEEGLSRLDITRHYLHIVKVYKIMNILNNRGVAALHYCTSHHLRFCRNDIIFIVVRVSLIAVVKRLYDILHSSLLNGYK